MTAGSEAGQRILRHFRVLLAADVGVRILVFGTAIVAARQLGPKEFGWLSVALAAVSYAAVLGDGGLTGLSQQRLVRSAGKDDPLIATTTLAQLLLAVLASGLLAVLVWVLPLAPEAKTLTLTALPVLFAQALGTTYALQAAERMTAVASLRFLGQLITTACTLALLAVGLRASAVTTANWIGLFVADAISAGLLIGRLGWRPVLPDRAYVREFLRQAWPFLLALLSTQAIINADIVVLGLSRPALDAGRYGAAFRFAGACLSLVGLLTAAAFPELVRRLHDAPGDAGPFILRLVRMACRPGCAAAALVILSAPPLVRLLYGASYSQSADYLAVLFLLVPLGFYNTILAQSLLAAGHQRLFLRAVGTTAVLTILALALTVPAWGPMAAAIVTVLGELTSTVTLSLLVRRPLTVRAWPVLVAQLPFLAVPLLCGAAAEWLLNATAWEAMAVAAVVALACEAVSPVRLLPEILAVTATGRTS